MGRLRFLTAGESHGPALAATIEGVPAGLPLTADEIAADLARRQRGYGRGARSTSIEQDRAEILAGVRHGLTLGSPILLLIRNRDWVNWTRVMQVEPLTDEQAAELAALAEAGDKRADADHPPAGRPRRPGRGRRSTASTTFATSSSAPRRARRRLGWRPGPWPGRCSRSSASTCGRSRPRWRRGLRPGQRHPLPRGGRGEPAALPGPAARRSG